MSEESTLFQKCSIGMCADHLPKRWSTSVARRRAICAPIRTGVVGLRSSDSVDTVVEFAEIVLIDLSRHVATAAPVNLMITVQLGIFVSVIASHNGSPCNGTLDHTNQFWHCYRSETYDA